MWCGIRPLQKQSKNTISAHLCKVFSFSSSWQWLFPLFNLYLCRAQVVIYNYTSPHSYIQISYRKPSCKPEFPKLQSGMIIWIYLPHSQTLLDFTIFKSQWLKLWFNLIVALQVTCLVSLWGSASFCSFSYFSFTERPLLLNLTKKLPLLFSYIQQMIYQADRIWKSLCRDACSDLSW